MDARTEWEARCRRLAASDRGAYEEVFRLTRDDLVRYVAAIVRSDMTAHDLVQDVFVSLWHLRETLEPDRPLRAYLFRMAKNRAYRHLRDERLHQRKLTLLVRSGTHAEDGRAPERALDGTSLDARLQLWLRELPERQREALTLSRFHGLSHREVAEAMEVSPRTVNNHIVRALEHLRRRLQQYQSTAA